MSVIVKNNASLIMNDHELKIMKHFSDLKIPGFCKVYAYGMAETKHVIVQEKLGESLYNILNR